MCIWITKERSLIRLESYEKVIESEDKTMGKSQTPMKGNVMKAIWNDIMVVSLSLYGKLWKCHRIRIGSLERSQTTKCTPKED